MCALISSCVKLISSWEIENQRTLEETLTVTLMKDAECDLENIVNYETCVHLLSRNNEQCELKFQQMSAAHNLQMAQIAIVSEARIIELYGNCGEYLNTTHADFIDEFEDMSVYMAVLQLPEPLCNCSIKLLRPKTQDQIWIYGVNVALEKVNPKADMSVNFDNVNRILKESGHQLTEKAEKCKKFLQMYGSAIDPSKITSKPPDPQVLMKIFESAYLPQGHPFEQHAKTVSQCLTALLPGVGGTCKPDVKETCAEPTNQVDITCPTKIISEDDIPANIKFQIDQCFHKLEKRLDEKLYAMESKLNDKLDLILLQIGNLQTSKIH